MEIINNVAMYFLLFVIWGCVGVLVYGYWNENTKLKFDFQDLNTLLVFSYDVGSIVDGTCGEVIIIKDARTYTPKVTRDMNSWKVILPLDATYEDFIKFVESATVPDYYYKGDMMDMDVLKAVLNGSIDTPNNTLDEFKLPDTSFFKHHIRPA